MKYIEKFLYIVNFENLVESQIVNMRFEDFHVNMQIVLIDGLELYIECSNF